MNELVIPNGAEEVSVRLSDQLPVEYYSPFVDAAEIVIGNTRKNPRGAYNISENVLFSKEALQALKLPHLLSKRNRMWKIPGAKLRSDNRLIDSGSVEMLKMRPHLDTGAVKADLTILFNNSDYLEAIGDKTLHDLTMGGNIFIPKNPDNESLWPWDGYQSNLSQRIQYVGPDTWLNLPYSDKALLGTNWWAKEVVLNGHDLVCFPSFKGRRSDNEDDVVICNWWDDENQNFYGYSNEFQTNATYVAQLAFIANRKSYRNPIVPCYYYHQVIRHCFSEFGFTLDNDWLLDDQYFKKLHLLNNFSIVRESILYLTGLKNETGGQPLTAFDTDDTNALLIQEDTEIKPQNHLAKTSIKEFLQDFCLNFGCRFKITGDRKVIVEHLELEKISRNIEKFGPEPEIISTRFEGFQLKYNLSVDSSLEKIDGFKKYITSLRETNSQPFSPVLGVNEYGLDRSLNTVENSSLSLYLNNLIPYTVDSDKKSFEIAIPPAACSLFHYPKFDFVDSAHHKYSPDDTGDNAWMPFIDSILLENEPDFYNFYVPGIDDDDADGDGIQNYYLVLTHVGLVKGEIADGIPVNLKCFYHGLRPSSGWITTVYPYASNHNFKPGDGISLGWFHLGLHGSEGIIKKFLKDMMLVWMAKEYHAFKLPMNWDDIISKKWNQCENIRAVKYYVSSYKFNTPIVGLVTAECYPIIYE